MPLITLCGPPLSGKTTLAKEIAAYAAEAYPGVEVMIVNFESLKINRQTSFQNAMTEKRVNELLRSAVERHLTLKRVVVLDGLNMIKGYRYELYTRAREVGTPHCVIHVDTSLETVLQRHTRIMETDEKDTTYTLKTIHDLYPRVEIPDPIRRWDNPMFSQREGEPSVAKQALDLVLGTKASLVSFSTTPIRLESQTFVRDLDKITQDIVRQIMIFQQNGGSVGGMVLISLADQLVKQLEISLGTTNHSSVELNSVSGGTDTPSHFACVHTGTQSGTVNRSVSTVAAVASTEATEATEATTATTAATATTTSTTTPTSSKIKRGGRVFGVPKTLSTTTPTPTNMATETTSTSSIDTLVNDMTTLSITPTSTSHSISFPFTLTRKITLPELLVFRRNYTRVSALMAFKNPQHVVQSFVEFLQVQIGNSVLK